MADPRRSGWVFHPTGLPLSGKRLRNPRRDTSARRLGRSANRRYRMRQAGARGRLLDFNVYCSPARLRVRANGKLRRLRLHHVDGLRQQARGRGLDGVPRTQYGALESPDGSFRTVTVQATRSDIVIEERRLALQARAAAIAASRLGYMSSRTTFPPRTL